VNSISSAVKPTVAVGAKEIFWQGNLDGDLWMTKASAAAGL
jgi:hypothetical protein